MDSGPFPFLRLFFSAWLVYAINWAPFVVREHLPAMRLAESGTLDVSPFLGWSDDVFAGPRGGAFINNNPGASLLGAIPLVVARPLLAFAARQPDPPQLSWAREPVSSIESSQPRRQWYFWGIAFFTAAFLMAPVSALSISTFGAALWRAGIPRNPAIAAALFLGFATPFFLRTGYLNHNLLVAHCGLFAAVMLWNDGRRPGSGRAAAAGFLSGYAVVCDFTGVLVVAVLGAYAWLRGGDEGEGMRGRIRTAAFYCVGGAPTAVMLALYQRWAFGDPVHPSQHFMTAIEQTSHGYRGFTLPSLEIASINFFNPTFGLFAVCPVLALAFAAPFVRRVRFRMPGREMAVAFAYVTAFVVFCASNQYSTLQGSTGIRYLVPIIPALALLTLQVAQALPRSIQRLLFVLAVSMAALPAITHDPLIFFLRDPFDLQISWVRRLAEHGVFARPIVTSLALFAAVGVAVTAIWKRGPSSITG